VSCVNGLCTTDLVNDLDGGAGGVDVPAVDAPAADAVPDAAPLCGNAVCGAREVCVLVVGGPVPLCLPTNDGGTCDPSMVRVDSCSVGGGPGGYQPGCTTPAPSPTCHDVPDACADICQCVCHMSAAPLGGCQRLGGYFSCSYP